MHETLTFLSSAIQSDLVVVSAVTVWFTTFLFGENSAFVIFTLSFEGYLDPFLAIVFVFLGSLSADLFWYGATVGAIRPWYERRTKKLFNKNAENKPLIAIADRYPYVMLVLIKFLVGVRLVLTVYIVTKKRIPFGTYLLCNTLANILFVGMIFYLTHLFYTGAEQVITAERSLATFATILFAVAVVGNLLLRGVSILLAKILERRTRKSTS